jgi:3-oxoacyl-[acyl-carrier protein] reductase
MEIRGKTAIVTGGASGIGRASALALGREGARVAVADVDAHGGAETVRLVAAAGGDATFIRSDVSTPAGIEALFKAVEEIYGGVDIVHNNAGIMTGDTPGWPDASLEKIHQVITVNTAGVLMGTRQAVQAMRKRGGGAVVNTASIAGLSPMPFDPIYAASKAAIILFTQSCAGLKETDHVRVNAVLPGMVETPIIAKTGDGKTPAKWLEPALRGAKLLSPEEIAAVVLEFVKDDSLAGETRVVMHGTASPS